MGGHAAGEIASRLAVQALSKASLGEAAEPTAIREAISAANRLVYESASGAQRGMGTTCALLLVGDADAHIGNVGDSRIYRLRSDSLEQLTRDHTLASEMVDQGLISPDQAMRDGGSAITRALGGAETVDPDVSSVELQPNDRFVLCSDGLSGMISDENIRAILLGADDPQRAAQNLVDAAKEAGGDDNVTVVVVNIGAASQPVSGQRRNQISYILMLLVVVLAVLAVNSGRQEIFVGANVSTPSESVSARSMRVARWRRWATPPATTRTFVNDLIVTTADPGLPCEHSTSKPTAKSLEGTLSDYEPSVAQRFRHGSGL